MIQRNEEVICGEHSFDKTISLLIEPTLDLKNTFSTLETWKILQTFFSLFIFKQIFLQLYNDLCLLSFKTTFSWFIWEYFVVAGRMLLVLDASSFVVVVLTHQMYILWCTWNVVICVKSLITSDEKHSLLCVLALFSQQSKQNIP